MDAKSRKELEKLIKFCRKLNVSELKTGDTHVIFGDASPQNQKPRKADVKRQDEATKITEAEDRARDLQEEIEVSHIENPLDYEEAVARGMLREDDNKETVRRSRTQ